MISTQPLALDDFSGGITDHYVNGRPNQAQKMTNLLVLNNKSAMMAPGSELDDTTNPAIPAGNQRIGELINFNNNNALLVQSAKRIYYRDPSAYSTLNGPTTNPAFNLGSTSDHVSHTQWRAHLFATNGAFANPVKIFRNGSGALTLVQAGLPLLASNPVITPGAAGAGSYLYTFTHRYTYTVGSEEFVDESALTTVAVTNSGDPGTNPNAISAIPVLANGASGNYDTASIKIRIYRTIDGGTTFYLLGEVANGITVFTDNFSDSAIVTNDLLYTTGGVVENDPPPLAKFIHIVNNTAYYGFIKEGSEILKTQIRQSIKDDPDSVPAAFFDEMEDELTGLSSIQSIPIITCKKHIYRLEGSFDEFGRGFINHIRIHDTAGCISNRSLVQAENKLFWAGNDGFYYTDGYVVQKITEHLSESTYPNIIASTSDPTRIVGTFDEIQRRVIWAVETDSGNLDNDALFILDLTWGITKESTFTTREGGTSFRPTAICIFNKKLHRGDTRGYVFRHSDLITTDPKVDLAVAPASWVRQTIIYDYKSIATNFGSSFERKWVPRILLTARNKSNISIQINVINDDGKLTRACHPIRYRKNCIWGDPEFTWGDPTFVWNAAGLIEEWRRLPAQGIRLSYLQVQVTNAYTIITNSDNLGTATIDTALNLATLDTAATADWPANSVDYFLSFENDGYNKQYLVTAMTPDTLEFFDPLNVAPSGSVKWELKGYKKEEVLNLLQLTVHYAMLSKTQTTFEAGDDGGNA